MSRAKEEQRRFRRLATILTTSALMTGAPCYPNPHSLYSIPSSSPKRSRSGHNGHDDYDGFNSHDGHNNSGSNGLGKIFALGQAKNGSVLPGDLQGGPEDVIFYPWQCKPTVCGGEACLEDLHGCRQPSGWNSLIQRNLWLWP